MKSDFAGQPRSLSQSPSTRREWIEILMGVDEYYLMESPSTRREWIEIVVTDFRDWLRFVSLHTEGVD